MTALSPYAVYVAHLRKGELAYQYSRAAGRAVFFPRVVCPFTGSTDLDWRISKGYGVVYSTSEVHPRQGEPYNVSLIDCDEGFRLMSRVTGVASGAVRIGARVRFRTEFVADEDPRPVFEVV